MEIQERTQNSQNLFKKKNKGEKLTYSDFKTYLKVTLIKTAWWWCEDRHTDQWKGIESPEMNSHIYSKLIVDKGAKTIQWGKIIFLTNGAETTEYLYTKKIILDPYHKPYTKTDSK